MKSKRAPDSLIKSSKAKKETTISNYWLANKDVSESSNSNRFSILDTNDGDKNDNEPEIKIQKPPAMFVDIQTVFKMLQSK